MVSNESASYSKRLLHLVSWSHWFTFFNIIAAIVLSSAYIVIEGMPDTTLGTTYLITNWLSHIAFLIFGSFVLLIFPLILVYPKTRVIRGVASLVFTVVLMLLALDAFIYSRLGYHINASASSQILDVIAAQIEIRPREFWFTTIVLAIVILVFQLLVSNYAWRHLRQLQKTVFARFIVAGLVVSFFFNHILHIWADANLEYDILRQDTVLPLSYPATAKTLLTKYDLFNKEDYLERKNAPLSLVGTIPAYSIDSAQCHASEAIDHSTFIVLSKKIFEQSQIERLLDRSALQSLMLKRHIDTSDSAQAWFNLLYSLPNIYQDDVLAQNAKPVLLDAIANQQLVSTFTLVGDENKAALPTWLIDAFDVFRNEPDISGLVLEDEFKKVKPGLHIVFLINKMIINLPCF